MKKAIIFFGITFFFFACILNESEKEQKIEDSSNLNTIEETNKPIPIPKVKKETKAVSQETNNSEISVNVSPTKMNVFYIGVYNPVTIEASGIENDKLRVTVSSGYLKKTSIGYVFRAKISGETKLTISAEIDGKIKTLKSSTFKVELIPNPIAKIGEKRDGKITIAALLAAGKISTEMENFEFDVRFRVVRFTVSSNINGVNEKQQSNSSIFTARQIALIKKVRSGNEVYFKDIKVKGPDGAVRNLGTLAFTIQ